MTERLSCVDLFAGCGGLSLGLELAGFTPVFVNELSPDAMETYLINREQQHPLLRERFHVHDVKSLLKDDAHQLDDLKAGLKQHHGIDTSRGELDLLVGGPPCQGYSGIGHRRSYSVDKKALPSNHLYQDMASVIHALRPKAFLFENVRGLLAARWTASGEKGEIWEDVRETFASIPGYVTRHKLVHAKDYGVPQNRPRILLVGLREDIAPTPVAGKVADGFLPEPFGGAPDLIDLLGDLVDPEYANGLEATKVYPGSATTPIQQWLRTPPDGKATYRKGAVLREQEYSNHRADIVAKFSHMLANGGEIPSHMKTAKFAQRLLPERWGSSGPSITATSLADDYVHFSQPRTLTVREWARLQTFPDWYRFAGKRTTGGIRRAGNPLAGIFDREVPKYTQIGNAVPVLLAKSIGDHLVGILKGARR
jgi:DNA (cytosine-5)-methyltransferase 1